MVKYSISNKLHVSNKTEYLNFHIFIMITVINESRKLTKHISCKFECKVNGRKCNWNQK